MVPESLYIRLAVCHPLRCALSYQPLPGLYGNTPSIDCCVCHAMGRTEAITLGALEYEDHTSYCELCVRVNMYC